jgi:hypothetical protein
MSTTTASSRSSTASPTLAWRAVAGVKHKITTRQRGLDVETTHTVEFRLWSKPDAIKMAGQHLAMFTEKHELTLPPGAGVLAVPVPIGAEQWGAMAVAQQAALASRPDTAAPPSAVMALVAGALLAALPNVAWAPQPGSQTLFVTSPVFETLYEGTRGPGKTNALLMDFCQHVGKGHGKAWRGILFRRSYPALADIVTKAREWIPKAFPGAQFIQSGPSGYTWRFPEGEELLFRYIEKKSDYATYHGHEYPWIGFDELTMWESPDCYDVMKSCCRSSAPGLPRKYRATTNPHGPGHHWVKLRFIDVAPRGVIVTDKYGNQRVALHGHWSENRHLLDADPEYVNRLLQATEDDPDQQAAWVDGSWDVAAGAYFGAVWSRKVHVLTPFAIPLGWRLDRSFDWGAAKPFSIGWWAESDGSPVQVLNPRRARSSSARSRAARSSASASGTAARRTGRTRAPSRRWRDRRGDHRARSGTLGHAARFIPGPPTRRSSTCRTATRSPRASRRRASPGSPPTRGPARGRTAGS